MTEPEMLQRTRKFALDVVTLVDELPHDRIADHFGRQLLRSGTSTAANYRAACRAKSRQDMISKLAMVEEESDECLFWLDMLKESNRCPQSRMEPLEGEANEIVSIVVASIRTLRNRTDGSSVCNPKSKFQNPKSPHE